MNYGHMNHGPMGRGPMGGMHGGPGMGHGPMGGMHRGPAPHRPPMMHRPPMPPMHRPPMPIYRSYRPVYMGRRVGGGGCLLPFLGLLLLASLFRF